MFFALIQDEPEAGLLVVDMVGLGLIGLFALLGLWRGLWWQLMRLVGLAGAVVTARSLEPMVSGLLEGRLGDLDARVLHGVVWLVLFLLAIGVVALIGRIGKRLIEAVQLGLVDRVGGAVAGALTGLVLHAAGLAVLVQLASDEFIGRELGGTFSERVIEVAGIETPLLFQGGRADDVKQRLVAPGTAPVGVQPNTLVPTDSKTPAVPPKSEPPAGSGS